MAGGPSKINPPNSHPSNPIDKQATEAQGLVKKKKPTTTQTPATNAKTLTTTTQTLVKNKPATQTPATDTSPKTTTDPVDPHHVNKALVALGAGCFSWLCCLGKNIMILFPPLLENPFNRECHHSKY